MVHDYKVVEKLSNFPQYRWEVTCEGCGWQGRGPTEDVADSMGSSHAAKQPEGGKRIKDTKAAATKSEVPPAVAIDPNAPPDKSQTPAPASAGSQSKKGPS